MPFDFLGILTSFFAFLWSSFLLLAPMLLLGLHDDSLKSVTLDASHAPAIQFLQWGSALLLIALIVWRFQAGALRRGYEDMLLNLRFRSSTGDRDLSARDLSSGKS